MTVIFYTATCYLDVSLEVINVLKRLVDLHVLIEIHPGTQNVSIADVERLPQNQTLVHPKELLSEKTYQHAEPYFSGVKSVNFVTHSKRNLWSSLKASRDVYNFIKSLKPDVFHLEALLLRSFGLLPALVYCRRLIIVIHDPIPHSGEKDWKISVLKHLYFRLPMEKWYLFYSNFAKDQFARFHSLPSERFGVLTMDYYTYFRKLLPAGRHEAKHILFFGRLSKYKGINVLLEAMRYVLSEFPDETLIIAGRAVKGFYLDELPGGLHQRVVVIDRYISNEMLATLISNAKFVVCPYIDASQSGVLMTSFALNTPVIATNVGAFPEFIRENINGFLVEVNNAKELANGIRRCLRNDTYLSLRQKMSEMNSSLKWENNARVLMEAYTG
jgi:glycosyltransferase involved in cell wall biosynthesis